MTTVPKTLQGIFWSKDISGMNFERDKEYIIHQVLMYGSISQIKWLMKVYSKKEILDVFLKNPRRIYTDPAFNFVKNFLLKSKENLEASKYVKSTS